MKTNCLQGSEPEEFRYGIEVESEQEIGISKEIK